MTDLRKKKSGEYAIGYGRPPSHSRFRKGMSGNPGGRPRGMTAGRAKKLALKEAYRPITVREGDKVFTLPAIQVVLRQQVAGAVKGNGPAQRAIIEMIPSIEQELAAQTAAEVKEKASERSMSDLEVARRIAFLLERGRREQEQQNGHLDKREA
jgi:hypothetical protein